MGNYMFPNSRSKVQSLTTSSKQPLSFTCARAAELTFKCYSKVNVKNTQKHDREKERKEKKKRPHKILCSNQAHGYQSQAWWECRSFLIYGFHRKETNWTVLCDLQSFEVCLPFRLSDHDDTLLGSVQSSGDYDRHCKSCHIIVLLCLFSEGKESHAQPTWVMTGKYQFPLIMTT